MPLHLGGLHPVEQVLVPVLAFGPFVLLGLVIWWRHQHPAVDDEGGPDVARRPRRRPRRRISG